MILADTSIWVDHFRAPNADMVRRLERDEILMHSLVLGELMLGGLGRRHEATRELRMLPLAPLVDPEEVEELIEAHSLHGRGIGYVDAVLLGAVRLRPESRLWTLDRRLSAVAAEMAIALEG